MSNVGFQYYVLICDKKNKQKFIELVASHGGVSIDTMYGKGSAKAGALAKALGFDVEEQKAVISCLISTANAQVLTEILKSDHDFHRKNTGIAFGIPLGGVLL